ncbi:MAG: fibronectin type III domain-containing protein [Verrucomicrobia bacterium]|nr:fibronectin type III domain-containing protein [Verrucomicrobiota bacterium]MCH8526373.1 fibronectin type III domain-containing protein [Kiritimatiellia bacterium]
MKTIIIPVISILLLFAACGNNEPSAPASAQASAEAAADPVMDEVELVPPELLEPENNATVFEEKPLFRWSEVPGRDLYQVEIHQYEDLEAPAWSDYPEETSWRISENFSGLQDGETYFWRVRRGMSDWSEVYTFTVDLTED